MPALQDLRWWDWLLIGLVPLLFGEVINAVTAFGESGLGLSIKVICRAAALSCVVMGIAKLFGFAAPTLLK